MSDLLESARRPRSALVSPLADFGTLVARCLRLSSRNLDAIITSLMLPVMIMLLFVYLFGGAINTGTEYVTYVVPGVLLLCAGFGAASTAVTVNTDMTTGVIDRFRSMDISGAAVLGGHVVASVVRNAISTAVVLGIAVLIGFRPNAGVWAWIGAVGVLLLYVAAMSWLSATVGLLTRTPEGANGFTFFAMFLAYPSSAFVPISTMPSWMQGFAENQPVTPVIETIRGLVLGTPVGSYAWLAVVWSLGIMAVSMISAAVVFRRRTA